MFFLFAGRCSLTPSLNPHILPLRQTTSVQIPTVSRKSKHKAHLSFQLQFIGLHNPSNNIALHCRVIFKNVAQIYTGCLFISSVVWFWITLPIFKFSNPRVERRRWWFLCHISWAKWKIKTWNFVHTHLQRISENEFLFYRKSDPEGH